MPLAEAARFARADGYLPPTGVGAAIAAHRSALNRFDWLYCGYAPLVPVAGVKPPTVHVRAAVDNMFRLSETYGFEQFPIVVTTALRTSRFAAVLFWEVLHVLAPGGLWIDVDETERFKGTPIATEDYLAREYFSACLVLESRREFRDCVAHAYRKTSATPLAARIGDQGWTFGILTSGQSPRAARMASDILAMDLPEVEVIFCGPRPQNAPVDDRVRTIDLDRPEPRGWITRKKNLLADAAQHENLCLLHDRYVITPEWADALKGYGSCFSFVTFPHVYFADVTARFPQRYPDYQLLNQHDSLVPALEANIYDSERIFHPAYDDFAETAFCCGGLYMAKRSLWNLVRQNEGLYHCEWEDISFGLECQRRGMPHRVNTLATAESTVAHPLLLTRLHALEPPARAERGRVHVSAEQADAAQATPDVFKPILPASRDRYYATVLQRFNAVPQVEREGGLSAAAIAGCEGLADFWRAIDRHTVTLRPTTREDIAQLAFFLSDTVYKWPTCQVMSWIRSHEQSLDRSEPLLSFETVVGWGTGSLFSSTRSLIGRDLAFVVDSNRATWGTEIGGLVVRPPSALSELDPSSTAVVVFSCFFDEIAEAIRRIGSFGVFRASDVASGRFAPLANLVAHFEEVERYFPTLFSQGD